MILAATYGSVANDTVIFLLVLLAVVAQIFVVAVAVWRLIAFASSGALSAFDRFTATIGPIAIPFAFVVAATAMAGSLYFSIHIGWLPCNMCWYQRTTIYPLAVILGVATFTRSKAVIPYALALAIICIPLSTYHYLLEWFPGLESSVCDANIPCSVVYLREFGYMSIPLMAGTCVLTVITLLLLSARSDRLGYEDVAEDPSNNELESN